MRGEDCYAFLWSRESRRLQLKQSLAHHNQVLGCVSRRAGRETEWSHKKLPRTVRPFSSSFSLFTSSFLNTLLFRPYPHSCLSLTFSAQDFALPARLTSFFSFVHAPLQQVLAHCDDTSDLPEPMRVPQIQLATTLRVEQSRSPIFS